jgi:hypothetical protein
MGEDSEMNNEPVAWMSNGKEFYVQKNYCPDFIPLYTHSAKESKAKDRFSNYESICLQCGITIYKPQFKTLTDEEIEKVFFEIHGIEPAPRSVFEYARAILRKAQEK